MGQRLRIIGVMMTISGILIGVFMFAVNEYADQVEPVEPYPFTDAEAEEIKELINSDMVWNGYSIIDGETFGIICDNLELYNWDWNRVLEEAAAQYTHTTMVGGISFGYFSHAQVFIRLIDATDGEGDDYYRSLGAGFCEHVD